MGVLAALVARQSADLSVYADFITAVLAGTLPPESVNVVRKRGLLGTKPDAPVLSVSVRLGDRLYALARPRPNQPATATVSHVVNAVVLSTKTVGLAEWAHDVAAALTVLSESNADAAAALARMTNFSV